MTQSKIDLTRDEENNKKDHPISSREVIYEMLEQPMLFDALFARLDDPKWASGAVYKRMLAMVRDQQLAIDEHNCFYQKEATQLVTKEVLYKASSLVVNIDGVELTLTDRHAQGVFPHDEVLMRVPVKIKSTSVPIVVRVNTAKIKHVLCVVKYQRGKMRIIPFDQRIKQHLVLASDISIDEDTVIEVKRAEKQNSKKILRVSLVKKVGTIADQGIERLIAKQVYQLSDAWPHDVHIEGATQQAISIESNRRESWVHLPLVTIDGIDAKDYDDAVYAEKTEKGFRLYVAIADVSHYVLPGTELDIEAKSRANSVYLPGHVIPMLPETLSNNICSLLPEVDRLALGCVVDINEKGERIATRLAKVVIRSHARLTYEQVQSMLDARSNTPSWFPLSVLDETAKALRKARVDAGTIVLRSHETKFSFDDQGELSSVSEVDRVWSHQIIEECMLCANMAVGTHMRHEGVPLIYRSHSEPNTEKVAAFQDYLNFHGIDLPNEPQPKDLQAVIDQCRGNVDEHAIEMMVLRTLSQAHYSIDTFSHYALSTNFYTHFTSPIRRYVDLTVHRAITNWLNHTPQNSDDLALIAENASTKERKADEASWFAQAWLKAKWVMPSIGKRFDAKVASITHFGMFVALESMPVEGLVHISAMGNEYFSYYPDTMTLQGGTTGLTYGIGDYLNVKLQSVDLALQRVDFVIDD